MDNVVKAVRTSAGLTQEELSKKSGISRTIISGLENGTVNSVTTDTIVAIAEALGVSVNNIFFFE